MKLKDCFQDNYFNLGLALRILLIFIVVPAIKVQWFIPFLSHIIIAPSLDPWTHFIVAGGSKMAFPYGIVMAICYLPGILLGFFATLLVPKVLAFSIGLGVITIIFDYMVMYLLQQLTKSQLRHVILFYWLSPIVIYINYWHGQLDIVPVFFLISSLFYLQNIKPKLAGTMLALSISAKLSMAIAAPILLIYLWRSNRLRSMFLPFISFLAVVTIVLQLPFLFSHGFLAMIFQNPEFDKVTMLGLAFNHNLLLYILPLAYTFFIYGLWRLERMSADLLYAMIGLGFVLVLIFTPASAGWYLWVVPFVVIHQLKAKSSLENILILLFSLLFVLYSLIYQVGAQVVFSNIDLAQPIEKVLPVLHGPVQSIWLTLIAMLLGVIGMNMYMKGVRYNDYFRLSRKPLAIGISGDSGSGKDTLSDAIETVFHGDTVATISGDDYHKWDRYGPMWKHMTHLNPKANDLYRFAKDVLLLLDGKTIHKRHYDHSTGRFSNIFSVKKNDVVIVSGLHVLFTSALKNKFDVKVFLKMDEELRRFFKLQRDVLKRGHTEENVHESMMRRLVDAENFITPQSKEADLVFCLEPINYELLQDYRVEKEVPLRLRALIKNGIYHEDLARNLIGLCGVQVDVSLDKYGQEAELLIDGTIYADDVKFLAQLMVPHMDELLSFQPVWENGMTGVMQLIVIIHTAEMLHSRLL